MCAAETETKPANHWFHIPLQIVGVLFCVYFYFHLPKSGKALLVLGGIVAVMMLMDMRPVHKGIYVLIVLGLVLTENRALDKERKDTGDEQSRRISEENARFEAILKNNQDQFDATMQKSNSLLGLSKENLDNITGGDSYAYVAAGIGPQGPPFQLLVWVKGKHGVHNVAAQIQKVEDRRDPASIRQQLQSMHSLAVGNGDFLPGPTPINESVGSGRYAITIISRNQWISEQLDGQWSEAINMNGPGKKENNTWKGRLGCNKPF